ncbi:MAG: cytochrome P450 [Pseudomonadales bacterium]|nr:cytochrome P450 [Pseudomonadales bacterium]
MSEFDMPEFQREDASILPSGDFPDPWTTPIERVDVSDSRLFQQDAWRPYFERLRRDDPVHFTAESPFGPYWSVTKFDDIAYVERNHEIFSSFPTIAIGDSPTGEYIENFIAMDPPKHEQQRKTVQGVVAPRNLSRLEPVIRAHAAEILDALPADGVEFDWVDAVSIELTTRMLATLFDFPFEDRRKLTYWSDLSIGSPESTGMDEGAPPEEVMAGLQDMAQTFMGLWAERAAADPSERSDLITMLAHSEDTKDMVTRPLEFLGNIMLLIVGGNDTTRNSISGGVLALNQFPSEYAKLRNDPSVIPNMVSEIIRWQTPVLHMRRTLTVDHEYKGKQMKAGEKVVMWYISGNRDEDAHNDADRLIIDRPNARQHVSFGFGVHRCMGNRLAEMQLKVVWEEIQRRFHMVECVAPETRLKSNFIRGIRTLPVRLHRH